MRRRHAVSMAQGSGPSELCARWKADATVLRRRGAEALAMNLESCAADLETWAKAWQLEALTLEQAAAESGFSYSHLQHLVADGTLRNAGSERRPRIRRQDLPRKVQPSANHGPQLADRVLGARKKGG